MTGSVPILLYHAISDVATTSFRRWAVPPARFASQMAWLAAEGFETLTVAELASCRTGSRPTPERPLVITFDDGYADFSTEALPMMRSFGLRSTLYITAGYIGSTSEWLVTDHETGRKMLTWEQLAECAGPDVELAAHGYSHRQLDTLPSNEAIADVTRGVQVVNDRLGPVETFAYPHGYSTKKIRLALRDLGLVAACGVGDAVSAPTDDDFDLMRVIVPGDLADDDFPRLVAGEGLAGQSPAWKRTGWRWVRKARLTVGLDTAHEPS